MVEKEKSKKTPKLKTETKFFVTLNDWDDFVTEVYGKPYSLQQQNGRKSRGIMYFDVPAVWDDEYNEAEYLREGMPTFAEWLARDPKMPTPGRIHGCDWEDEFWWNREFYPQFESVLRDLSKRGLIEPGEYVLVIDL